MSTYPKDLEEKINSLEEYQRKFRQIRHEMHLHVNSDAFDSIEKEYNDLEEKLRKEFRITPNRIVETLQKYEEEWLHKIMHPEAQAPPPEKQLSFTEKYEQAIERHKPVSDHGKDDQDRER